METGEHWSAATVLVFGSVTSARRRTSPLLPRPSAIQKIALAVPVASFASAKPLMFPSFGPATGAGLHVPPSQAPPRQPWPHSPQFAGSLDVSLHPPSVPPLLAVLLAVLPPVPPVPPCPPALAL